MSESFAEESEQTAWTARTDTSSGSLVKASLALLCFLLSWSAAWWSGLRGINFGHHWDERKQIEAVERLVQDGRLLPDWYNYPSMCFVLSSVPLAPEVLRLLASEPKPFSRVDFPTTSKRLEQYVSSPAYKLRIRRVFLAISLLGPLWLLLGLWRWRGPVEACLAAAIYAVSFELSYHARWIAPDAVMTQFVALFLALGLCSLRSRAPGRWLFAAAVAAGLATGTKYTAGLLIVPLCALAWETRRGQGAARLLRLCGGLLAIWAVSYLLVTPGTLLEPVRFYQDLKFERRHYTEMGHYGYSVRPWLEHSRLAATYLATTLSSPHLAVALMVTALAVLAAAHDLLRSGSRRLWILLSFPLLYFVYFASTHVLFVRNLLVFLPFVALLAARGVGLLGRALPRRGALALVHGLAWLALSWNAVQLVQAARSIRPIDAPAPPAKPAVAEREHMLEGLAGWIRAHPERRIRLSPELNSDFRSRGWAPPPQPLGTDEEHELIALYTGEGATWGNWESNRPGCLVAQFGPLDVQYEWYTSWTARRILVLRLETARELGIDL